SEVGMAARRKISAHLAAQGVTSIPPAVGLQMMSKLLVQRNPEIVIAAIDWPAWVKALPLAAQPTAVRDILTSNCPGPVDSHTETAGGNGHGKREQLLSMPLAERSNALQDYMCGYLSKILKMPAATVPKDQPLNNMGLDSLIAMEFEDSLHTELGTTIPIADL